MKPYCIHHVAFHPNAVALPRLRQSGAKIDLTMVRHHRIGRSIAERDNGAKVRPAGYLRADNDHRAPFGHFGLFEAGAEVAYNHGG